MTIKFPNSLESSFLSGRVDYPIITDKQMEYIAVNPYFIPYQGKVDMSFAYMDIFSRAVKTIQPYYKASVSSEELITESLTPIEGVNLGLCLLKYSSVKAGLQDVLSENREYKRIPFTRMPLGITSQELLEKGGAAANNDMDAKMIAASLQLSALSFLIMLKEIVSKENQKNLNDNDRLMLVYLIRKLCPQLEQLEEDPDSDTDVYVLETEGGVTYYVGVPSSPDKAEALPRLSALGCLSQQDAFAFNALFNSDGTQNFNRRVIDSIKSNVLQLSCGWLMSKMEKIANGNGQFEQGSMIQHLNHSVFTHLLRESTIDYKVSGDRSIKVSEGLKMLLDISTSVIANTPANLTYFDNGKFDEPLYLRILGMSAEKLGAVNKSSIDSIDKIKALVLNDFSRCCVIIDNSISNLLKLMKASNLLIMKPILQGSEFELPAEAFLSSFNQSYQNKLMQKRYELLILEAPFLRICHGTSISPLVVRATDINKEPKAADAEKRINEKFSASVKEQLENNKQYSSKLKGQLKPENINLDVLEASMDRVLSMLNDLDSSYARLRDLTGFTPGNDGLSMLLTVTKSKDSLATLPLVGSLIRQGTDYNTLIGQLVSYKQSMNEIVDVFSKEIDKYLQAISSLKQAKDISQATKDKLYYGALFNGLGLYVRIGAKASVIGKRITDALKQKDSIEINENLVNIKPVGNQGLGSLDKLLKVVSAFLNASRAFYVFAGIVIIVLKFQTLIEDFFYSGMNLGIMGAQRQQKEDLKRIEDIIKNLSNEPEKRKIQQDVVAFLTGQIKATGKTITEGLDRQMRKPSIFDAPGILAVNAAYVAVGLFAAWGATKLYFMAKENRKRLDAQYSQLDNASHRNDKK